MISHVCHIWIKPVLASEGQYDKNKPIKPIASACRDLTVVYLVKYTVYKVNWWNYVGGREPNVSTMFVNAL